MNSRHLGALWMVLLSGVLQAQQQPPAHAATEATSGPASSHLQDKLDQIVAAMNSMQHQLDESKQQIDQLQNELRVVRGQATAANGGTPAVTDAAATALQSSVLQLQNEDEILQSEVKQHDQTKVESLSKYPVKISGLLLFSSFLNDGAVDNIDLPIVALSRTTTTAHGSLAATFRQTILGLEAKGPTLWGARSFADAHVDFFGGVPYTDYTTSTGTLRLRTAHARLDWADHSLIAALDAPLISPLQPTSYLGIGEPPLAWSGNLWVWAPQLESVNRTKLAGGNVSLDFALMDPASPGSAATSGQRRPDPSEQSRQPAYESRVSFTLPFMDRPFTVGGGGYYSRQTYSSSQHIDAWAGTADWSLPLTPWLGLSGALYRGRAIGGLGGGTFKDYLTDPASGAIHGLDDEGGWSQIKAKITRSFEANFAIGEDAAFSSELREYTSPTTTDVYANLNRNRTLLTNIIFRPKSYLLFSAEFRNIHSWPIAGQVNTSQSLGLATGYSF